MLRYNTGINTIETLSRNNQIDKTGYTSKNILRFTLKYKPENSIKCKKRSPNRMKLATLQQHQSN